MEIIQGAILFREGKKWKKRYAVLRPNSANPDIHALVLYKDASHARSRGNHKRIVHLLGFCGITIFGRLDKVESGLAVITANETIYLAFDSIDIRDKWKNQIQDHYGKENRYVVVVPEKQKIKPGEASLHVYNKFFGLTSSKTLRCIGRWTFQELECFASIDGGFMFQTLTIGQMKGAIYKFSTLKGDEIMELFNVLLKEHAPSHLSVQQKSDDVHGSGVFDDLQRSERDPTFFQRCVLRMSARLKKPRRGNRKQSRAKGGAAHGGESSKTVTKSVDVGEKYFTTTTNGPEVSMFTDNSGRETSVAWVNSQRSASLANFSAQQNSDDFTASYKNVPRQLSKRVSETSRGRSSRTSGNFESRTGSMCSDVFDDAKSNQGMHQKEIESNGGPSAPPSAPPRSPISLVGFSFSGSTEQGLANASEEQAIVTGDNAPLKDSQNRVISRGSSPIAAPVDPQKDQEAILDEKRAKEYEELMKRFQGTPSPSNLNNGLDQRTSSTSPQLGRRLLLEPKDGINMRLPEKNSADDNTKVLQEEFNRQNAALPPKPGVVQKYVNVKIPVLPSLSSNDGSYINVSGSATVGRASGRSKKPQPLRLTSGSLWDKYDDEDVDIYHQVDPIVGGGSAISRSVENFGNYRNINGVGSYENLTINGAPMFDKSRVVNSGGVSPSKGLTTSLNYILVDGAAADTNASPKSLSAQTTNRNGHSPLFDAWPAYDTSNKTDYTLIDDKATQLLNRTRQQHWQQRQEAGQMKRHGGKSK